MTVARAVAGRSKHPRTQVGAALVADDNRKFLGVGFNGFPPLIPDHQSHWDDSDSRRLFTIHAESNCLWFAADAHGTERLRGSLLYVTAKPCSRCLLEAVRAGVGSVIYDDTGPQPRMVGADEWLRTLAVADAGDLRLLPYSDYLEEPP